MKKLLMLTTLIKKCRQNSINNLTKVGRIYPIHLSLILIRVYNYV